MISITVVKSSLPVAIVEIYVVTTGPLPENVILNVSVYVVSISVIIIDPEKESYSSTFNGVLSKVNVLVSSVDVTVKPSIVVSSLSYIGVNASITALYAKVASSTETSSKFGVFVAVPLSQLVKINNTSRNVIGNKISDGF